MTPDERARERVWDSCWKLGEAKAAYMADINRTLATVEPPRKAFEEALDAFERAVELRTKATMPCYSVQADELGCRRHLKGDLEFPLCPSCEAREEASRDDIH